MLIWGETLGIWQILPETRFGLGRMPKKGGRKARAVGNLCDNLSWREGVGDRGKGIDFWTPFFWARGFLCGRQGCASGTGARVSGGNWEVVAGVGVEWAIFFLCGPEPRRCVLCANGARAVCDCGEPFGGAGVDGGGRRFDAARAGFGWWFVWRCWVVLGCA